MQEVTDVERSVLNGSHVSGSEFEIYHGAKLVATSYSDPRFIVVDGSVSVQRKSKTSRTINLTILDPNGRIIPGGEDNYLDPMLMPIIVFRRGIYYIDEDGREASKLWSVGTFVIESVSIRRSSDGQTAQITGGDRSVQISGNKWDEPYNISSGNTYSKVIRSIIENRAVGFTPRFRFEESEVNCPAMTLDGDDRTDPWDEAQKLAEADGKELFVSGDDTFVLRTIPDVRDISPVWSFDERSGSTLLSDLSRDVGSDELYNGVIVRGTAPWLVYEVVGAAWDTDPNSPTNIYGPLGKRPKYIDDAMVSSTEQAQVAAEAKLRDHLGVVERLELDGLVNPALEQGDGVFVFSRSLIINDTALLDSMTIPVRASESMKITIRMQRSLVRSTDWEMLYEETTQDSGDQIPYPADDLYPAEDLYPV